MARAATNAEIARLIAALGRVRWPADLAVASEIAEDLGWRVTRSSDTAARFVTTLGVDDPRARALVAAESGPGPGLESIRINVSDRRADAPGEVHAAFDAVCGAVARALGPAVRCDAGDQPRLVWDLPSGGRVAVQDLSDVVILTLLSRAVAELERDEVRLGIDPHRVPGTGHDEL